MPNNISMAHHIRALPPAIKAMQGMGYTAQQCLEGTGITEEDLSVPEPAQEFTLDQEFRFHRNLLRLTSDPLLGLKLGKVYTLQSYGLVGYAFLSAPTLRQALTIVRNYGPLTFTLFRTDFVTEGPLAILRFCRGIDIPQDLLTYYIDRDLIAASFGGEAALPTPLTPAAVCLMHGNEHLRKNYEEYFGCPVAFNTTHSELHIAAASLDHPMPMRDAQTSALCQQQCQLLLARMSKSSGFVDRVRQLIVTRPGYFPDIDLVAEKLHMTSRTLRRRLTEESSSFQQILAEVRYQLAREYLGTSNLPIEEISVLLGYSSPGNFTNAFKRWHGSSPRAYRKETN